jgi:hypothetical protein
VYGANHTPDPATILAAAEKLLSRILGYALPTYQVRLAELRRQGLVFDILLHPSRYDRPVLVELNPFGTKVSLWLGLGLVGSWLQAVMRTVQ